MALGFATYQLLDILSLSKTRQPIETDKAILGSTVWTFIVYGFKLPSDLSGDK